MDKSTNTSKTYKKPLELSSISSQEFDGRSASKGKENAAQAGGAASSLQRLGNLYKRTVGQGKKLFGGSVSDAKAQSLGAQLLESIVDGTATTRSIGKLISKGASLNVKNESGYTALMRAIQYGQFDIAEQLIEAGAPLNKKNSSWR